MCQESKKPSGKDSDIREDKGGSSVVGDEHKWGNPPKPPENPKGDRDPKTKPKPKP